LRFKPSPIAKRRIIKTSEELELLRKSQSINKQVYDKILPFLLPGVTEREIARRILILQLELGGDGPSFPPIVAFGENTAIPHHSPKERILQVGDIILIDMGVIYQGYCSDMTRCCMPEMR
jgi:Xaa-Pro aminopeptidase